MKRPLLIPTQISPNNFDFIRFMLAVSVIFCHSFAIYYGYQKFLLNEPFMVWSHQQISIGSVAVDFFFIISGFLILKSFQSSKSVFEYLKKRVSRIFPGFIVAYLISILVVGFFGSGWQYDLEGYEGYISYLAPIQELVHLLTLQRPYQKEFFKGLPEPGLNDSMWTIQFEFICYLLIPVFSTLRIFKSKWWLFPVFIISYLIVFFQMKGYIFQYKKIDNLFFDNPFHYPRFIMYFLAGSCCFFYRNVIIRNKILTLLSIIALIISFGWIKAIDQVLPLAGSYLLFNLAFHPAIKLGNFAKYGDLSYGVYLYGWPVQELIMYYFQRLIGPYSLFFTAVLIVVPFAYASWHLIEKPFLKRKLKKKEPPYPSWKRYVTYR